MVATATALRTASKLSVLVIDDDQDIREYLQDFLTADGGKNKTGQRPVSLFFGRGGGIRTRDPLHPMQVRYQAALRPVTRGL